MSRIAKSILVLRAQVDSLYPHRDKTSDGIWGDLAHSKRKSDHNPNALGLVTAIDIDADLDGDANGPKVGVIVESLRKNRENWNRIKYIIYRGQITVPGDLSQWKLYTGPNGHYHHAHISVKGD